MKKALPVDAAARTHTTGGRSEASGYNDAHPGKAVGLPAGHVVPREAIRPTGMGDSAPGRLLPDHAGFAGEDSSRRPAMPESIHKQKESGCPSRSTPRPLPETSSSMP